MTDAKTQTTECPTQKDIYTFIKEQGDGVSFVELLRNFPSGRGDISWMAGEEFGEVILYTGLSETFMTTLNKMVFEKIIKMKPTTPFVYLIDGAMPPYPIVKTARKYKKPHWLPVVFDHVAGKEPE